MLNSNGAVESGDSLERSGALDLSETITVRLTPRELECIARLAELRGLSLEDMTRELLSLAPRHRADRAPATEPAR